MDNQLQNKADVPRRRRKNYFAQKNGAVNQRKTAMQALDPWINKARLVTLGTLISDRLFSVASFRDERQTCRERNTSPREMLSQSNPLYKLYQIAQKYMSAIAYGTLKLEFKLAILSFL